MQGQTHFLKLLLFFHLYHLIQQEASLASSILKSATLTLEAPAAIASPFVFLQHILPLIWRVSMMFPTTTQRFHARSWGLSKSCTNYAEHVCQGLMSYIDKETISSLKMKRNQFTTMFPGLQAHQYGFVVMGNWTISIEDHYTMCSRSDDG